ncbi:sugar-binding protein [Agromyces subbeticus]|uniref:sugar-binding protein n=1 Tax=Agromyces subbeticus TaxID=293890 RepID=UPI0003B391AC|nr:sugar-binding protein [Agromyces subbeticus]
MKRHHAILLTSLIAVAALMGQGTAVAATMGNGSSGPPDAAVKLEVGDPAIATETERQKIDIMGIWAHPDDDAGFTTPCGVWNDLYGVRCGIIMATRGEGGSNSVGPEAGPDLGLRRENEDRTSHIRSGTVDIFNLDRVDFFYNTSAPLTAKVWDAEETLSRTVRIIRETRPEILVGSTPSLAAGHGNHQYAQGRMIWEAAAAAADPGKFPEQLTGVGAVEPWQVKKILAGGLTTGTGGVAAANCNAGFVPAATNPFTVVGTWTGHESPYVWAEGNLAGRAAGSAKTWAQVGREGGRAHPTQARTMQTALVDPTCQRYGVSQSIVPMQPNSSPASANDDAVLYGAVIADPGGMPLGSEFSVEAEEYFEAAGEPFTTTVALRSGDGQLGAGTVKLVVPAGWQVSAPVEVDGVGDTDATQATFTVTPASDAAPAVYKLSAEFAGEGITAYNDTRIELVAPVEGRFERWGTAAEYEQWTEDNDAYVGGRSKAVAQVGAGETVTVPVVVANRTAVDESGTVDLAVPAGFVVDAASKPFADLAPGETTTIPFVVTHTDPADPGSRTETFAATTTSGAGVSTESETVYLVPTVVIPQLGAAPAIDGTADELYVGQPIDVGTRWEGAECAADGVDCGDGGVARLGWHDDALYAQIRVTDDVASAASTPDRCFGHWLVDSVELLLDPRGDSIDTSSTFKLGMFPFTDDADGANGNGTDGPCWSRDADNHQGFSTGPLAETVEGGLNAEGVEVAVQVVRQADGTYAGGGYDIEVKVPLSTLPAAVGPTSAAPQGDAALNDVDPDYLGLNVTPYDSDTQNFIGQTRTAWSAFGSQQSEPYRWGHAYLDGYAPPADRSTESAEPIIPDTALQGVQSPQTVAQSATRGGTISGVQPSDAMAFTDVKIQQKKVTFSYRSEEAGTVRVFLWKGDTSFIPVWTSSCAGDIYGFEACSPSDGAAPPWAPDMSGRLLGSFEQEVAAGKGSLAVPIDASIRSALADDARILISYADEQPEGAAPGGGVNAWSFPIESRLPGRG